MNIAATQASGLQAIFDRLTPPPVEHDRELMRNRAIQNAPQTIIEAREKARRLSRLEALAALADYIGGADMLECKLIINELIDRVSGLTGCAHELEDAACMLTREMKADDAADSLRSHVERRDES